MHQLLAQSGFSRTRLMKKENKAILVAQGYNQQEGIDFD